jgi:DNA-directed RNA polymerase specialized sigma24 family protein
VACEGYRHLKVTITPSGDRDALVVGDVRGKEDGRRGRAGQDTVIAHHRRGRFSHGQVGQSDGHHDPCAGATIGQDRPVALLDSGRYPDLRDRHGLWQVLLTLTINKAIDIVNHSERDKRAWRRTVLFSELAQGRSPGSAAGAVAAVLRRQEPDPAFIALLTDQVQWLWNQLEDDQLRAIVLLKLEGYTNAEIARQKRCAISTVERRLRLVRRRLERCLAPQAGQADDIGAPPRRPFSETSTPWA